MIVPTYTATAKNVTGVAGQPMSFRVPGGALSQGLVAQAQLAQQVTSQAAQWGSAFYGMHRSAVIGKAVKTATESLDEAQINAEKLDVLNRNKKQQPSEWFGNEATNILAKATAATSDPITAAEIASQVSGLISSRQRAVNKVSRLRIVQVDQGILADRTSIYRDEVARTIPQNWDGSIQSLPAAGQEAFYQLQKIRKNAAANGTISYVQEQKGAEQDGSYITEMAVNKRLIASATSEETQKLLNTLRDGKSWPLLNNEDLQKLELKAHRQMLTQQNSEEAAAKQNDIQARKAEKAELHKNEGMLLTQIYDAQHGLKPGAKMPTIKQINNTKLEPSARRALMAMVLDETPRDTKGDYFTEIHQRLREIETAGLTPGELEEQINALQKEVLNEVGKKHGSRINNTDAVAFSTALRAVREKRGYGGVINDITKRLEASLKKNAATGRIHDRDVPLLEAAIRKATRVLYHEGGTPDKAYEAALSIMGRTRLRAPYPGALPIAATLGVPQLTAKWSMSDHIVATQWIMQNQDKFRNAKERDDTIAAMLDIQDAILEKEADAAARAAGKKK